jgi:hypothetical protein
MKRIFFLPLVIALSIFCSCQKQQTDAERQAEIDRQVQQRLDAEHQAQEKEQLAQRQADLNAREKTLAEKENAATSSRDQQPSSASRAPESSSDRPTASYNTFYTKLDPYGEWRQTSDYGYVWQPREAERSRSWRPYTDGHWVYTDSGWTWISEEPFGWATYHYGRWTRLRNIGWVWVPGDEWAPAWVSWRKSDDYVGWAPLPPEARFDRRTGIHNWSDNYYDTGPEQYCFVETKQFGAPRIQSTILPTERNVTIINQTTNVTNITYSNTTVVNQGPSYDEIRKRTQQPIARLRLERQVNVDVNSGAPQSVVHGEMVVIPAPLIARGQAVERPRRVKETVAQVVVDRGWEAIADKQAAERVRVKMKSEATPPPDAPPKTFVKPMQTRGEITPSAPTATATSPAISVATSPVAAPTATEATSPPPVATATPQPAPTRSRQTLDVRPSVAPATTATSSVTATPRPREQLTPNPRAADSNANVPRRSPTPLGTPINVATPTPSPAKSVAPEASASRSISPSSSASPAFGRSTESNDQRKAEKELRKQEKTEEQQRMGRIEKTKVPSPAPAAGETGIPSPSASPSTAPSATASPFLHDARESRKEEKKIRKRERADAAQTSQSVSSSPSATPQ